MALNWISSRIGSALPLIGYRAGARELERQTRRGVGVGGSHRDVRGHGRRAALLGSAP